MKKHFLFSILSVAIIAACSGAESQPIPYEERAVPTFDASRPDTSVADAGAPDADATETSNCIAENDAAFCGRNNKQCGAWSATDNCGVERTVSNCGACSSTEICSINTCKDATLPCVPHTDAFICNALVKKCGPASVLFDNCGKPRDIASCGTCAAKEACNAAGTCECVPDTDAVLCVALGKDCGTISTLDNCGKARNNVVCPACQVGFTCGVDNKCAACTGPKCDMFTCGTMPDGCGNPISCGNCPPAKACTINLPNTGGHCTP